MFFEALITFAQYCIAFTCLLHGEVNLVASLQVVILKVCLTRPRCGLNRAVKLMVTHTVQLRFCYCFYLFANVQFVKRDIVTTVIYCYITTDFHCAKRDSRLSAYEGVMLQRVGIEENVNGQLSLNF